MTFGIEVSLSIDALAQRRNVHPETAAFEVFEDGAAARAAVLDVQIRIAVPFEVRKHILLVVKGDLEHTLRVVPQFALGPAMPELHFVRQAQVQQVNADREDVKPPVCLVFEQGYPLTSFRAGMAGPEGFEVHVAGHGPAVVGDHDFHRAMSPLPRWRHCSYENPAALASCQTTIPDARVMLIVTDLCITEDL